MDEERKDQEIQELSEGTDSVPSESSNALQDNMNIYEEDLESGLISEEEDPVTDSGVMNEQERELRPKIPLRACPTKRRRLVHKENNPRVVLTGARRFEDAVDKVVADQLKSQDEFMMIWKQLEVWRDNALELERILERSYLLKEIIPLSEMVTGLTAIGIEALDYLSRQEGPPQAWKGKAALMIERAEKPQAEMLLAIVAPIKKIVEAANALP